MSYRKPLGIEHYEDIFRMSPYIIHVVFDLSYLFSTVQANKILKVENGDTVHNWDKIYNSNAPC